MGSSRSPRHAANSGSWTTPSHRRRFESRSSLDLGCRRGRLTSAAPTPTLLHSHFTASYQLRFPSAFLAFFFPSRTFTYLALICYNPILFQPHVTYSTILTASLARSPRFPHCMLASHPARLLHLSRAVNYRSSNRLPAFRPVPARGPSKCWDYVIEGS